MTILDAPGPDADDALAFHEAGRPGKLAIVPTKPLATPRDLSLAYSPGVAQPCLRIAADPAAAYDYTAKGNMVAVVSNGTAILGLGNLGALASKPVMEGKAVLFKRFADIDGIDLCVDEADPDAFVETVRRLGPSFGGINLEDIRAPDCFVIERRLREAMDIPVFHDDQHGTAIVAAAGLLNAADITGRTLDGMRVVVNGAGAAAIACADLIKALGVPAGNVTLCDSRGVVYQGRAQGMNPWKAAHAGADTGARTLADALVGADMVLGVSAPGAVTPAMVGSMAPSPIVFALANPDPEITPEAARAARRDAIVATGRSDHANQVNNVLAFPYIFRGALDVRARTINDAMKLAAAQALAGLARREPPPGLAATVGRPLAYGPDYIIPVPFDPRLITEVAPAVAAAATSSGVARRPLRDVASYREALLRHGGGPGAPEEWSRPPAP